MTLPPAFYCDPARSVLRLSPRDPAFLPPRRLATESARLSLGREDGAMAGVLRRAWRSGASEELLSHVLSGYATAHGLDAEQVEVIRSLALCVMFKAIDPPQELGLMMALRDGLGPLLAGALATAHETDDPCWCPDCIAEAASFN